MDAVRQLPLPAGQLPSQELTRYRNYLKVQSHRLKILHRSGAGGREICQARSLVLDMVLRHLVESVASACLKMDDISVLPLALVAIGGYGRRELNPQSDIDIMFLHANGVMSRDKPAQAIATLAEGTLYPLYDIGVKVGHSVRSIEDCVKVANSNMQSKTSLIEARLVMGSKELFEIMQKTVLAKCVNGQEEAYIRARLEDQRSRRAKYGDSATMLEPNVKNGCGGLRDYQNLLWMAYFKYRMASLEELRRQKLVTVGECKLLDEAYDYLLRVRNDLHYHVNRPTDILSKNVQPAIAFNLGFTDRSPVKRIEQFLQVLYTHMRNVFLITRTLEERLAFQQKPEPRRPLLSNLFRRRVPPMASPPLDGFKFSESEIMAVDPQVFREQPRRLMRVFLYAQQRGLKLHPDLAQLIRNELNLANRAFLADAHVRETFLEILNQRGNVAPALRAMHEVGLLGRYLPEFGRLTCLVQHEFFHRYTADEHTLICVEMLDRVWHAASPPFSHFTHLFQKVERPYVLYLALLLHDAGKAVPTKKHTGLSARLALRVAKRFALDADTTLVLRLIIENHLAMVQISQRRDLDDLAVASSFADLIKTPENLDLLTLHTFADSIATSAEQWNDFKEALLWILYDKTTQWFLHGPGSEQIEEKRRNDLAQEVRRRISRHYSREELDAHFTLLPSRYFQIHTANQILADLSMVHRFLRLQVCETERSLEPVISWTNVHDRGYASVRICTWDRPGLFNRIAGSLTAAEMNILGAQIFSRADGIIFDTFYVSHARTGNLPELPEQHKFERIFTEALTQGLDLDALIRKLQPARPLYTSLEGEEIPTVIRFDNHASKDRTIIDIDTEDRVGLLYILSGTLTGLGLNISTAKITTEKGAAIDTFYVNEAGGGKILNPMRIQQTESALRSALAALDAKLGANGGV